MPFKSKKQKRWMYANKPEMAKKWEKKVKEQKLNENPAVIATAARMAIQNAQGKKVSVDISAHGIRTIDKKGIGYLETLLNESN